jgi:methylated-DNA-[protein]-cysteine S-methyltransferase
MCRPSGVRPACLSSPVPRIRTPKPGARAIVGPHVRGAGDRSIHSATRPDRIVNGAWTTYESPIGRLTIEVGARGDLRRLSFPGPGAEPAGLERRAIPSVAEQLDQYFAGERRAFDLEVEVSGTPLQTQIWRRLLEIPYGATITYGALADELDPATFPDRLEPHERARAVGAEVGRTPVPIVIPCHRVVGADGSLVGYGGGLERKRSLLALESDQLALL